MIAAQWVRIAICSSLTSKIRSCVPCEVPLGVISGLEATKNPRSLSVSGARAYLRGATAVLGLGIFAVVVRVVFGWIGITRWVCAHGRHLLLWGSHIISVDACPPSLTTRRLREQVSSFQRQQKGLRDEYSDGGAAARHGGRAPAHRSFPAVLPPGPVRTDDRSRVPQDVGGPARHVGDQPVDAITAEQIEDLLHTRWGDAAPTTFNRHRSRCRGSSGGWSTGAGAPTNPSPERPAISRSPQTTPAA